MFVFARSISSFSSIASMSLRFSVPAMFISMDSIQDSRSARSRAHSHQASSPNQDWNSVGRNDADKSQKGAAFLLPWARPAVLVDLHPVVFPLRRIRAE